MKKEKEGTAVQKMAPNMLMGMKAVIAMLKRNCFPGIKGRNFVLKLKIVLEKTGMIHYYISKAVPSGRHLLVVKKEGRKRGG